MTELSTWKLRRISRSEQQLGLSSPLRRDRQIVSQPCGSLAGIGTLSPDYVEVCPGGRKQRGAQDLSQEIDFPALWIPGAAHPMHQSEVIRVSIFLAATL